MFTFPPQVNFGSSLSLRSFARVASGCSVVGVSTIGSAYAISVLHFMAAGSSLSIRGHMRLAGHASVLDFLTLGSSLSLRQYIKISSAISCMTGRVSIGKQLSVLSHLRVASSLSVRSHNRWGDAYSILDYVKVGSSLSVRSFVRVGSTLSMQGKVFAQNYIGALSVMVWLRVGSSVSMRSMSRFGCTMSMLDFVAFFWGGTSGRYRIKGPQNVGHIFVWENSPCPVSYVVCWRTCDHVVGHGIVVEGGLSTK